MIKVSLVDDHYVVRSGLRNILTDEKDISITGESSTSEDIIRQLTTSDDEVDIVVLDFVLPGMNGLEALTRIKKIRKNINILMLSMYDDKELVLKSLKSGAAGFISKDCASKELILAVRNIINGNIYLGKSIKLKFKMPNDILTKVSGFSELDFELICLIASGKTTRQISDNLSLDEKFTIESIKRMMETINISNNIELVQFALNNKYILPA